jgi:hypothetical protein
MEYQEEQTKNEKNLKESSKNPNSISSTPNINPNINKENKIIFEDEKNY